MGYLNKQQPAEREQKILDIAARLAEDRYEERFVEDERKGQGDSGRNMSE